MISTEDLLVVTSLTAGSVYRTTRPADSLLSTQRLATKEEEFLLRRLGIATSFLKNLEAVKKALSNRSWIAKTNRSQSSRSEIKRLFQKLSGLDNGNPFSGCHFVGSSNYYGLFKDMHDNPSYNPTTLRYGGYGTVNMALRSMKHRKYSQEDIDRVFNLTGPDDLETILKIYSILYDADEYYRYKKGVNNVNSNSNNHGRAQEKQLQVEKTPISRFPGSKGTRIRYQPKSASVRSRYIGNKTRGAAPRTKSGHFEIAANTGLSVNLNHY